MRRIFYIRNMSTGMYVCNNLGEKREFANVLEARKFILKHNLNTDIYAIVSDKS